MDRGPLGLVLQMSRVVGMAPFTRAPELRVSNSLAIRGRVFIIINGILVISSIVGDFYLEIQKKPVIDAAPIIGILLIAALTAANIIGVFTAPARITRIAKGLDKLKQFNIILYEDSIKNLQNKLIYKGFIFIGGFFGLHLLDFGARFKLYPNLTYTARIINALFIFNLYILTLLLLQITFFAKIVNSYLIALNENLQHVICDRNIGMKITSENLSTNIGNGKKKYIPQKIRELATLYQLICEIVMKSSEGDGAIVLLFLAFVTMYLEENIFLSAILSISNLSTTHIVYGLLLTFLFALYSTAFIIFFAEQFHQTHYEMNRTFDMIQNCKSIEDELEVEHELELFHRMLFLNKVEYSPLDLITIDRTLIMKLFSGLITYLVITFQYGAETRNLFRSNTTLSSGK